MTAATAPKPAVSSTAGAERPTAETVEEPAHDAASDQSDPRCGYPKKDGSPCRNKVAEPGKVCRIHQKAALLDRIMAGRKAVSDPETA